MLDAMPLDLFYRWGEFNQLQPFTPERMDMRFAVLDAVVANSNPFRGKGRSANADDFMPKFDGKKRKRRGMSGDAMKDALIGGTIREAKRMGIDPETLYGKASDSQCKRISPGPDDGLQTGDEACGPDRS